MNVFYRLLRRRALFFTACSLLLALGVAFSSIGVSTYAATRKQKALIDAGYTSIAIPNNEQRAGLMPWGWYQKVFPEDG